MINKGQHPELLVPEWVDDIIDSLEERYNVNLRISRKIIVKNKLREVELTNNDKTITIYCKEWFNRRLENSIEYTNVFFEGQNFLPKVELHLTPSGHLTTNITIDSIFDYIHINNTELSYRYFHNIRWIYGFDKTSTILVNGYVIVDQNINPEVQMLYIDLAKKFDLKDKQIKLNVKR